LLEKAGKQQAQILDDDELNAAAPTLTATEMAKSVGRGTEYTAEREFEEQHVEATIREFRMRKALDETMDALALSPAAMTAAVNGSVFPKLNKEGPKLKNSMNVRSFFLFRHRSIDSSH